MTSNASPTRHLRHFGSDNYAGVCPEAWGALEAANRDHAAAYGEDPWTAEACNAIREFFETDCDVFFVFNGTSANSLSLASMCQPYHSVLCHELAHIEADECGAPEFFSNGTKILLVPGANGKLDLKAVEHRVKSRSDIHYPKPHVVCVTQATEMGTVYTVDELKAVGELARGLGLRVHMDGARLCNAVAALGVAPKDITWKIGVDVLCFGMTKNGLLGGEAVVFFNRELAYEFDYRCKQGGQLASKMRFLSAPWVPMLRDGVGLRNAAHANAMARRLAAGIRSIPSLPILFPSEANSVFVAMPEPIRARVKELGWRFHNYPAVGGVRFMCAWDIMEDDVDAFVADLRKAANAG